jgi:dTDP-glucose 4,6-dehydratase
MRLIVTGGAGFIGSSFVRRRLASTDDSLVVLDKLTYAGNLDNLAECDAHNAATERYRFVRGDICDGPLVATLVKDADAVINFAAESHVDRSILDAAAFLRTGVIGVHTLLEAVREAQSTRPVRFVQVSTDEIYGEKPQGLSREDDPMQPRSPYASAKAAGELLVNAYVVTHGVDAVITRGSNTYGPHQHPEKIVPLFITNALQDQPLPMYGDGQQQRDWLFVDDHADAVGFVLDHGESGSAYNIPGTGHLPNRELTKRILELLDRPWSLVRSVPDRPGHDTRYAMDGSRLAELGWRPTVELEDGLARTVNWFRDHADWWQRAKSGDWADYYESQYAWRLAESVEA